MALLGVWAAWAADAPIAGRSLVAAPCPAPRSAECAPAAAIRFAPPAGVDADALQAKIGVAWVAAGLVVRIAALPPGHQLEVTLSPPARPGVDGGLAKAVSATLNAVGNSVVAVPDLTGQGEVRALRLLLVEDGTAAGPAASQPAQMPIVRAWAPTGPGDLSRPGWLLTGGAAPSVQAPPSWDGSALAAPGFQIDVQEQVPLRPGSDRRSPAPWRQTGADRVEVPPLLGPVALSALVWQEDAAGVRDLSAWSLQLPAPLLPAAGALGIHPTPALLRSSPGVAFRLANGATIRLGDPALAALATLVADECERLLGRRPAIGTGPPGPGDIGIGLDPGLLPRQPWGDGVLPHLRSPQGFAVAFASGRVQVWGADPLGALYGSLALVDALAWAGASGVAPLVFADHPDRLGRGLRLPLANADGPAILAARRMDLLRRVVTRGRFDTLIIDATDGLRFPSHPELSRPGVTSGDDLRSFAAEARALGLGVVPGVNLPADDARWLISSHPELAEDGYRRTVCTRHPSWPPMVEDLLGDLLALVPGAAAIWIGQERLAWKTTNQFEDERCPRCQGAPHWWVGLEDATAAAGFLAKHGVGTWLGNELPGLAAGAENPPLVRDTLRLAAAGRLTWLDTDRSGDGDSWEVAEGWRGPWSAGRRPVLLVAGSGAPWSGWATGRATVEASSDHWARILGAGVAAWTGRLAGVGPDALLTAAASLPAYRPGSSAPPGRAVRSLLGPANPGTGAGLPLLPAPLRVGPDAPLTVAVAAPLEGVALLAAITLDRTATAAARALRGRDGSANGPAVAELVVTRAGGAVEQIALRLGLDVDLARGPLTCQFPWAALDRWTEGAQGGAGEPQTYTRQDLWLSGGDGAIEKLDLRVLVPGAQLHVAALAQVEAADVD